MHGTLLAQRRIGVASSGLKASLKWGQSAGTQQLRGASECDVHGGIGVSRFDGVPCFHRNTIGIDAEYCSMGPPFPGSICCGFSWASSTCVKQSEH
jgi:hypothetical protein